MARPKAQAPALRYHISGQSVVTIEGRDYYLGKHDSAESIAKYAALITAYQANELSLPDGFDFAALGNLTNAILGVIPIAPTNQEKKPIRVRHLSASFLLHSKAKYSKSFQESMRFKKLCEEMDEIAGDKLVEEFGPLLLQKMRQQWIDEGKARVYCNRLTNSIIRIFKWGVSQELVSESVHRRLRTVEPLRIGQTEAPETRRVEAVPIAWVEATAKELSPVLRSMLRIQIATGMRPSELCRMRPCDIDRTTEVWAYRPPKHKNASKGKSRFVPLVGDAREAVTDYLNRDPSAFLFSPQESLAWFRAAKRAARKSKVQPSQVSRARESPSKKPGDCFDPNSYRQSIQRAAKRAGVPHWHPYQLRHLAATVVRKALGVEAAQALLGHSRLSMTEHYAPLTEAKAIAAAAAAPTLKGAE